MNTKSGYGTLSVEKIEMAYRRQLRDSGDEIEKLTNLTNQLDSKLQQTQQDHRQLSAKNNRLERALSNSERQVSALERQVGRLEARGRAQQQYTTDLEGRIATNNTTMRTALPSDTAKEARLLRDENGSLMRQLTDVSGRLAAAEKYINVLRGGLDRKAAVTGTTSGQLEEAAVLRDTVARLEADVDRLEGDLAATTDRAVSAEQDVAELRALSEDVMARHEDVTAELDAAQGELAGLRVAVSETDTLRNRLEDATARAEAAGRRGEGLSAAQDAASRADRQREAAEEETARARAEADAARARCRTVEAQLSTERQKVTDGERALSRLEARLAQATEEARQMDEIQGELLTALGRAQTEEATALDGARRAAGDRAAAVGARADLEATIDALRAEAAEATAAHQAQLEAVRGLVQQAEDRARGATDHATREANARAEGERALAETRDAQQAAEARARAVEMELRAQEERADAIVHELQATIEAQARSAAEDRGATEHLRVVLSKLETEHQETVRVLKGRDARIRALEDDVTGLTARMAAERRGMDRRMADVMEARATGGRMAPQTSLVRAPPTPAPEPRQRSTMLSELESKTKRLGQLQNELRGLHQDGAALRPE